MYVRKCRSNAIIMCVIIRLFENIEDYSVSNANKELTQQTPVFSVPGTRYNLGFVRAQVYR